MAHNTPNSFAGSLKAKVWQATIALGVFVAAFGLIAYLVQSFLIKDHFYAVVVPFLILAILVTIFGRRVANEIAAPVERVSLLAKSFERGMTTTLPKTTGAAETDELLQTVHRLSRQTKKIVEAMEAAADGNTDAALAVDLGSDKASQTFQKLLVRISESIRAKQDLERLRAAIKKLSEEVSVVRDGDLNVAATPTDATKELSETLNFLIEHLAEMTVQIQTNGARAQEFAEAAGKTLEETASDDENKVRELNRVSITLKQVPQTAQKISEDLAESAARAAKAGEKAQRGTRTARENLESVGALRRKIQETVRRTHRLRERSREISAVAKTIEDLARRATMVALNASIQSSALGESGRGFAVVSGEIERLATRADETGKAIASLNKSVQSDIGEVETSLESTFGEAANLSRFAIETGVTLDEMEKYLGQFLNLQNELTAYAGGQSEETEKAFQAFTGAISETAGNVNRLRQAARNLHEAANLTDALRETAADFKTAPPPAPETGSAVAAEADFVEFQMTIEPPVNA